MKLDAASLYEEYEAALAKTHACLGSFSEQLRRRAGAHYTSTPGADVSQDAYRQNVYHKWLSYVVPQLVWRNPRVKVGALLQSESGEEFELELAGNRWIVDNQARKFLAAGPAVDMQFNFGVVACMCEPVAGARPIEGVGTDWLPGDPTRGNPPPKTPWSPKWYRIAQERYFEDALATTRDEIRLQGHIWVRDKAQIIKEGEKGGWNLDAIEEYASDARLALLGRPDYGGGCEVKREEIVGVEIWVPEYDLEEGNPYGVPASLGPKKGMHGTIFTLLVDRATAVQVAPAKGDKSASLGDVKKNRTLEGFPRKPRPWYGSERGPYVVFGQYTVPGHTLPLGTLTACEEEIRQLNMDLDVAQRMMRAYKRLLLIARGTDQEVQVIKDGDHDNIYKVAGISREDVIAAEIGGISDQVLAHIELSKDNLEGTLGFSDFHSGKVAGVGLATEQEFAHESAAARFAGLQQTFEDAVRDLLWRTLWFIYEDNRYGQQLGPNEASALVKNGLARMQAVELPNGEMEERLPEPVYLGGERQGLARVPFSALSIDIEAYSMERTSEARAQQNMAAVLGMIAQLVPMAAQFPDFAWGALTEKLGEVMNFPGLGEMFGQPRELAAGAAEMAQLSAGTTRGPAPRFQPALASMPAVRHGGGQRTTTVKPQARGQAGSRNGAAAKNSEKGQKYAARRTG